MEQVLSVLDDHMYVVVITLICLAVLVNSFVRAFTSVITTQARERSRREIAAYIAEGSLSPEQGERLMKAEVKSASKMCM
ncbi:MAG: hypothetical protein ACYSU7_11690 [Planctomycetota bacterium]|jgi:hypothetical protein